MKIQLFLSSLFKGIKPGSGAGIQSLASLDKIIKILIYALVVLIPLWFLPLTVNVVDFNKQALMILLIVVTLILWLIKILSQGELKWKSNIINILIGVFALACILSTIFSYRPYNSLVGWPNHLTSSLATVLGFLALYILIVNNFKEIKNTFNLLFAFLASSAVASVVGLLQIWGAFIFPWDFAKSISFNTIGGVNSLGIFSAVLLTLITGLLFVIKRTKVKIFLVIIGIINLLILLSINYWILWLVLAIGMAVILMFSLMQLIKLEENISWIALPMIFLAFALIFLVFKPTLPTRPNLPIEVGLNYRGGFEVIKEAFKEKPILGSGPEMFALNYSKFKPENINQTIFWNIRFSNPPSEIFTLVSDLGAFGSLAFLAVLIFFIYSFIKAIIRASEEKNILKEFIKISCFAAWLALMVSWFIYPQNFTTTFIFWLLFSLSLANNPLFKDKSYNLKVSPKIVLLVSFSFVVTIILIVGFLYVGGTRFIAEAKYKNGLDAIQIKGELDDGIDKIIKSTVINPYEDRTYRILSQLFLTKLNNDLNSENDDQQEKLNIVQADVVNAVNSAARATSLFPEDVSNWLVRGQVYYAVIGFINGADQWAEDSYKEALKLEPKNPYIYTEIGKIYTKRVNLLLSSGNKDKETQNKINEYLAKALEQYDKAIEIKPDYSPAHYQTAIIFEAQGKLKEAIAKMEINRQILPKDTGTSFQLALLYYKAQDFAKAKAEFIRAIIIDPNFANARYFLGLLYDREGNKEDAIDQFDRIAKLNPDNEQIKQILENLRAGKPALGIPPEQPAPIEQEPTEQNKENMP